MTNEGVLRKAAQLVAERFERFRGDLIAGFKVRDELNPQFPQRGDQWQCTISGTIVRLHRGDDGALAAAVARMIPQNVLDIE